MMLGQNGLINTDTMLDYAAGYGTLRRILAKYFNLELPIFDPYTKGKDSSRYVARVDLVIIRGRGGSDRRSCRCIERGVTG